MRINFKQKELIQQIFNAIREKFPETEFISVTEGAENSDDLRINITAPRDEDREIGLIGFSGDKLTDILPDYGYCFMVMPRKNTEGIGGMKYHEIFA